MNDALLKNFYTTKRCGKFMSDHGGPFGFDIHFALEVNYCITSYDCDVIFETGTNSGDTTEFLAKQYPTKKIISCELDFDLYKFARNRLQKYKNVLLLNQSSEKVIKRYSNQCKMPFFYLDAHWEKYWPICDELRNISHGVICAGDFFVAGFKILEHGRYPVAYGHDSQNGQPLNSDMILSCITPSTEIYINNVLNLEGYDFPCHQSIRRNGRAFFCKNINDDKFKQTHYLIAEKEFNKRKDFNEGCGKQ